VARDFRSIERDSENLDYRERVAETIKINCGIFNFVDFELFIFIPFIWRESSILRRAEGFSRRVQVTVGGEVLCTSRPCGPTPSFIILNNFLP
jgi:hypothetical protein